MNKDYLAEFTPDLVEFREKTMQFHNKEMTIPAYKGFSGGFGSYAQRGGAKHMLRLRIAGGRMTKERFRFLADSCEKYHVSKLKLTTCQSIQYHNLEAEDLCQLIEEAWKADMISRGGGGDFPRNVMASALSGVDPDEYMDVLPYAEAMSQFLMRFVKTVKMPRKLKVAFSSSPSNETHATFRDLGFVATPDGKFDVYIAGGLGNNPRLGVKVAENVEPAKICYYAKAMVETFVANGNYENRGKARTRYMQETLGADGLKKAYLEKLEQALNSENLDLNVTVPQITKKGTGKAAPHKRLIEQKQEGLYAVSYQPIGGDLPVEKVKELAALIADMEAVEIRIHPEERMYIINCNAEEAAKVLAATEDGANTLFETSVACIGSGICQVGLRDSQALLKACVAAVGKENFADGVLPRIHISGCPSSCSAHQIADIGFRGGVKKTAEGAKPGFLFFEGGCPLQSKEKLSESDRAMAIDDIPLFLVELGKLIAAENTTYAKWIKTNHNALDALVAKYTA